jgi:peptidase E
MRGEIHLLGPQGLAPNLPAVLREVPGKGPVVTITAGWRHEEGDDEALRQDIGGNGIMLPIYRWFEDLSGSVPDLLEAHAAQQREIRALKYLYRVRLESSMVALRAMVALRPRGEHLEILEGEIDDALAAMRAVRERFVVHADEVRLKFAERYRPLEHPAIRARVEEIRRVFSEARGICIAGGHVGVLRNRMEFFDAGALLAEAIAGGTSVIAWSAGAMVLTERVVLFHDDPPVAQANAELLDRGFGLARDIVVLPHAKQRLFLDDAARVGILAARLAPTPVVGLEHGAWLRDQDGWCNVGKPESAVRLWPDGQVTPLRVGRA